MFDLSPGQRRRVGGSEGTLAGCRQPGQCHHLYPNHADQCHIATIIADIQRRDNNRELSSDAREVQNSNPRAVFTLLMQVVERVIGRTFTGGVTAVVSFNRLPHQLIPALRLAYKLVKLIQIN